MVGKKDEQKLNYNFLTFFQKRKKGGIMESKLVGIILFVIFLIFMIMFIFILKDDLGTLGERFVNMFGG